MQIINLYKYSKIVDGSVRCVVSPVKPECDFIPMYRLITDYGYILRNENSDVSGSVLDVKSTDGWDEYLT